MTHLKLDRTMHFAASLLRGDNLHFKKTSALLLVSLLCAVRAYAGQATLAWDANPDPAVAGYMLYYGESSRHYVGKVDAGKQTGYTVSALRDGLTYYYAVTAYDAGRVESGYSNEASAAVPAAASTPVATPVAGGTSMGSASSSSGGGGGGCTIGNGSGLDPTFALLLFAAGIFIRNRTQPRTRRGG